MTWQNIAASETDANSPLNQTLMDKIRGNLDHLGDATQGHNHTGVTGDGPRLRQGGLQTSAQEVSLTSNGGGIFSANYLLNSVGSHGFWPRVRSDAAAGVEDVKVSPLSNLDNPVETYVPYIYLEFNKTGIGPDRTLYASVQYVQGSRDEPVVWLLRRRDTGAVMGSVFDPEARGESHPFLDQARNPDPGLEVLALELKRSDPLRLHLFRGLRDHGVLRQVHLGLFLAAVRLTGEAEPGSDLPCLRAPGVKVMDFTFDPSAAEPDRERT